MIYTAEQQAIIDHEDGHASVKAVPGSGKTQAMVARVVRLMESGVKPRRIVVVMFNSQAAQDFHRRLVAGLKESKIEFRKDQVPTVRTLHSLASRMITTLVNNEYLPRYSFDPDKAFLYGSLCRERKCNSPRFTFIYLHATIIVCNLFWEAVCQFVVKLLYKLMSQPPMKY